MYADHSLRGDPKKEKLMNELNYKKCMRLKRKTTRKFFVVITVKGIKFIIRAEYFDANKILSRWFLLNLKCRPNVVQDL